MPDCVLWRIGFTGELSYELHVPAVVRAARLGGAAASGRISACGPFGVEAQRILRLEKGHLIVGQDTDGLTRRVRRLASAGLIKLDKDDFAGRPELGWQRGRARTGWSRCSRWTARSFRPRAASSSRATGSSAGSPSARMSPTLGRSICLGQVASRLAEPGTEVRIRLTDGRLVAANVTERLAAVDPEGVRLRG